MTDIKKNFGFGCMRLPMDGEKVDYTEFTKMVDLFLEKGFNYFDTAHGYVGGQSETALRDCLVKRHPRDSYILANKLSSHFYTKEEDIRPLFESQLEACGVDYFDYYLMHAQNARDFARNKKLNAYETILQLQAEGKIKKFGISFHDTGDVLEQILTEYPQIQVVQIQFNYADYDDPAVQSKACYDVCVKHNKPAIIMEPCKGGNLVNLPEDAKAILDNLGGGSTASYALRYAAGFEGNKMVLSGMSDMAQMEDNLSFMENFKPLNSKELDAVHQVCEIFKSKNLISCTACRYCTDGCPKHIAIPDLFACLNAKKVFNNWNTDYYYHNVYTVNNGKASACIKCGKCEKICPQHLEICKLLEDAAAEFETA